MVGLKVPIFERGTILTQEMLETLKNYAIDFRALEYAGYADGILCGCEVSMSGNMLYVKRGILVSSQELFFLPHDMKMVVDAESGWQVLRFCIGDRIRDKNFLTGEIQLELTSDLQECPNKIEICRFRLQRGAILRNQYRDFFDLNTEFDTVNEIYAQWSGYGGKSVSNRVLLEFARDAMKRNLQNQQDILFVQQLLSLRGKSMNREAIQFYLSTRLRRPYREMNNMEIFTGLCEVLRSCHRGAEGQEMRQREERRILVD